MAEYELGDDTSVALCQEWCGDAARGRAVIRWRCCRWSPGRHAGSKPRGHVVPADQGLTHNSFSGAPNGFFAPGGTAVWQAEAAFEWLLTAAFAP